MYYCIVDKYSAISLRILLNKIWDKIRKTPLLKSADFAEIRQVWWNGHHDLGNSW